ncbi:unnamed protein product [Symbiodinium natans]|uniref:Uncharacterized protein n=1 Tax=Symbiodinium natans TaxID=878477 RepID=A0A812L881_9DINO|nr:unnamed protein product [Symbiodinium natans]CAE7240862.1 unnamed protein product [Symbiodinium natans]
MAWSASEIREWASREALTGRVLTKAEDLAEEGGLAVLTDEWLRRNGVVMLPVRNRILLAAHVALNPNKPKAFRFGRVDTVTYDYVAPEYPEFLLAPPSRPRRDNASEATALRDALANTAANEDDSDEDDSDEEETAKDETEPEANMNVREVSEAAHNQASNRFTPQPQRPALLAAPGQFSMREKVEVPQVTQQVPTCEGSFWWSLIHQTFQCFTAEMAVQASMNGTPRRVHA